MAGAQFRPGWPVRPVDPTICPDGSPGSCGASPSPACAWRSSGCDYNTWWNPPFSSGNNPNFPVGDSENMRRVTGEQVEAQLLTPEPGDIWPGPLPPEPTLQDLEQQGETGATRATRARVARIPAANPRTCRHRRQPRAVPPRPAPTSLACQPAGPRHCPRPTSAAPPGPQPGRTGLSRPRKVRR